MALLFCDSFDYYNTSQLSRKWVVNDGSPTISSSAGRNGTAGLVVPGNFTFLTQSFSSAADTIIVGFAVKFTTALNNVTFFNLRDAGTAHVSLGFNFADGSITATWQGSSATSAAGALPSYTAQHNYVEVKVKIHDTLGTVTVKVNGTAVITQTGKDTKGTANAYATNIILSCAGGGGQTMHFDDLYICDNTGSANNDFLGDVRVECLLPNGAGSNTDFSPTAGSNYQCVDENPANDDTDYVFSSTVGHKDTYNFGSLSSSLGSVLAVAVNTVDRKDDAGSRTNSHLIYSGSTVVSGAVYSPTTSYVNHQTVFPTNPGGTTWTIADVNGVEGGHKIET
jgi:hypothetical protein